MVGPAIRLKVWSRFVATQLDTCSTDPYKAPEGRCLKFWRVMNGGFGGRFVKEA
jgi:hypothetical protein